VTGRAAPPVHLVDASCYVFRAWFAVSAEMTDPDGAPVNALYGFVRFLGDLLEQERPSHMAVAFDESLSRSFRSGIDPAYKANREPAPPELRRQFELCREACRRFGLATFSSAQYEADDIIGTLATRLRPHGHRAVVVTRDKDLAQLIREGDAFLDWSAERRLGYADIEGHFGVRPERMADFLALAGDASDNIRGVPGIGPRTAAALLSTFASLEEIYAGLTEVARLPIRGAAQLPERLRAHREDAWRARRLTTIACDMPLDVAPDDVARRAPDLTALDDLYDRAGFGAALRRQAARIEKGDAALFRAEKGKRPLL